jgi:hypothetical protein
MTSEDEEFNRIEREAKQRMEAVSAAVAQQELVQWGVDWGRAGQAPCVSIIKRLPDGWLEVVAVEYGPERTWKGLTDDERRAVRNSVGYNQFVTASEYAEHVQKATEAKLREKNT